MSYYPRDLEEYTDGELQKELQRREHCLLADLCPYCTQSLETHDCKMAYAWPRKVLVREGDQR